MTRGESNAAWIGPPASANVQLASISIAPLKSATSTALPCAVLMMCCAHGVLLQFAGVQPVIQGLLSKLQQVNTTVIALTTSMEGAYSNLAAANTNMVGAFGAACIELTPPAFAHVLHQGGFQCWLNVSTE